MDESSNELLQLRRKTQSLVPAWQQMATRGYGGEHVPSAMALMGMPAESERQRAHTAEVAYGQRQQLQDEEAMAMEQAFLSEGARADTAERHAAEMRDVVHALKDHVLKEQASSSTRPVVSTDLRAHRAAKEEAAPAAGRRKQPEQLPERPGVIWVGATPHLDTQQAMYGVPNALWHHFLEGECFRSFSCAYFVVFGMELGKSGRIPDTAYPSVHSLRHLSLNDTTQYDRLVKEFKQLAKPELRKPQTHDPLSDDDRATLVIAIG